MTVFNCPPVGSHIPSSGRLCMPARSVCFQTPKLLLGHQDSFKFAHDLNCMFTQTAPMFKFWVKFIIVDPTHLQITSVYEFHLI